MTEKSGPSEFEGRYQERERHWGSEPVLALAYNIDKFAPGTVMDLGAGDGRNSLYLAKQGFEVIAVDNAPTGIGNLKRYAKQDGVENSVQGLVADLANFTPHGKIDNMIATFALHFLSDEGFSHAVGMMQEHTNSGGINLIQDFIKGGPPYNPASGEHWLDPGELRQLYDGWEIIEDTVTKHEMMQTDDFGRHLIQHANALVARKP